MVGCPPFCLPLTKMMEAEQVGNIFIIGLDSFIM